MEWCRIGMLSVVVSWCWGVVEVLLHLRAVLDCGVGVAMIVSWVMVGG